MAGDAAKALHEYQIDAVRLRNKAREVQAADELIESLARFPNLAAGLRRIVRMRDEISVEIARGEQRNMRTWEAVEKLNETERTFIYLRFIQGESMAAISEKMHFTPQHLYNIKAKALKSLASLL